MKFRLKNAIVALWAASLGVLAISTATLAWFALGLQAQSNVDGSIGLRTYYHDGDGTSLHPYEITRPIHFYNLARLQNRGVYHGKTYFQIGHIFSQEEGPVCLDDQGNHVKTLDMTSYCANRVFPPIGAEGTPFYSSIDGNGIPVLGLRVAGTPEDIGVFGYVAHAAELKNLIFKDLEVHSLGYSLGEDPEDYSDELFSRDIDDLFNQEATNFNAASLSYISTNSNVAEEIAANTHVLKNTSGYVINDANAQSNLIYEGGQYTKKMKGYFLKTDPPAEEGDPFTYDWHSSSSLISITTINNQQVMAVDFSPLVTSKFNSGGRVVCNTRISLTASTIFDGIRYSRVIQSYNVLFKSNASVYSEGKWSIEIYCDYTKQNPGPNEHPTNYHHGINVGLLAGHLDGAASHCFVYDGTILCNDSHYTHVASESETGLIGEIGVNVASMLSPQYGDTGNGEEGVMNFSGIYSAIRSDFESGDSANVTREYPSVGTLNQAKTEISWNAAANPISAVSYNNKISDLASFNKFKEFLRHDYNSTPGYQVQYVTKDPKDKAAGTYSYLDDPSLLKQWNSVDFIWNRVIQDDESVEGGDRGLGVFKIVTAYNAAYKWLEERGQDPIEAGAYYDGIGATKITNGTKKTKVYYSTAECDWRKGGGWNSDTGNITPLRPSSLPTRTTIDSFEYPFSRDFDYLFEIDLAEENKPENKNYFYNAQDFLLNYLESILIDETGGRQTPDDDRFGFMMRDYLGNDIDGLSAYMEVGKPGTFSEFQDGEETKQYPSNSIVFKIDNEEGANVSVVGSGLDLSIYRNWANDTTGKPAGVKGNIEELFTMRSRNQQGIDSGRHYDYTLNPEITEDNPNGDPVASGTGLISPADDGMSADGFLIGHTFHLKKGDYVLGSASYNGNDKAKVYYLAVQGQNDANLGHLTEIALGDETDDVDFLLSDPNPNPFPQVTIPYVEGEATRAGVALIKALFAFEADFNTGIGGLQVKKKDDEVAIQILFNGSYSTPNTMTDHIFARCRADNPQFYLNNQAYTEKTATWNRT